MQQDHLHFSRFGQTNSNADRQFGALGVIHRTEKYGLDGILIHP